jgi:hypothetical protein
MLRMEITQCVGLKLYNFGKKITNVALLIADLFSKKIIGQGFSL